MVGKVETAINPESVFSNLLVLLRVDRPLPGRWYVIHLGVVTVYLVRYLECS
jgi:hypothetical protein